jgi:hypothetical protein
MCLTSCYNLWINDGFSWNCGRGGHHWNYFWGWGKQQYCYVMYYLRILVLIKSSEVCANLIEGFFFLFWRCGLMRAFSFMRFLDHTQRRSTIGSTPLDEWSARYRYLYLTTLSTHKRQASIPQAGFEPTLSAIQGLQTCSLDHATPLGLAIKGI